tara:strand:- start:50 stop:553 length:504 start_codon:yes stop_codon:yes gene_type:complete
METILLLCRGQKLLLSIKEIEQLSEQEWFISLLLKYEKDNDPIELCEDINIVLSVIETLKYKKLIIYNNISLDHMYMLCDKWCVPEWIKEEISEKISENKNTDNQNEIIYQCKVCAIGFKKSENTSISCSRHRIPYSIITSTFNCCKQDEPCIKGYHYAREETHSVA